MRATKEDVASLGIELSDKGDDDFLRYNYLCNFEDGTFIMFNPQNHKRDMYETFDKQIFLEACDMGTPTTEQVKAHFKNAKNVKSLFENEGYFTPDLSKLQYASHFGGYIYDANNFGLYSANKGYATIISTKEDKKPTLEEVKAHFKDAELVSCLHDGMLINTKDFSEQGIYVFNNEYWANYSIPTKNSINLWDKQKGYATIILTKEKKFEITKEQILEIHDRTFCQKQIENWFPECFVKGHTIQ
jgi:hypothetical protein